MTIIDDNKIRDDMTVRLEMNKYNTALTERQQKYQLYLLKKLIIMNILQLKKHELLSKANIEQAKLPYYP